MERWGNIEDSNPSTMTSEEIEDKFQLLKKDDAGNHNLLKSRACERCISTGIRQSPLGMVLPFSMKVVKTGHLIALPLV